jgi:hypothetical protein
MLFSLALPEEPPGMELAISDDIANLMIRGSSD